MNSVETLMPDEKMVLDRYRKARSAQNSTLELHIQYGRLIHINYTEKIRPFANNGKTLFKEASGA